MTTCISQVYIHVFLLALLCSSVKPSHAQVTVDGFVDQMAPIVHCSLEGVDSMQVLTFAIEGKKGLERFRRSMKAEKLSEWVYIYAPRLTRIEEVDIRRPKRARQVVWTSDSVGFHMCGYPFAISSEQHRFERQGCQPIRMALDSVAQEVSERRWVTINRYTLRPYGPPRMERVERFTFNELGKPLRYDAYYGFWDVAQFQCTPSGGLEYHEPDYSVVLNEHGDVVSQVRGSQSWRWSKAYDERGRLIESVEWRDGVPVELERRIYF